MKNITKILLFAFTFLFSLCAHAYDFEVDGIYYNVVSFTDFTCEVTSGTTKYSGDIVIPSKVIYNNREFSIVNIGEYAFLYCDELTSIVLPNTITKIGRKAFDGCSELNHISIPNSVTIIEYAAFSNTSMESIKLPNSLTTIGSFAFSFSRFSNIEIPNSVTFIGESAFKECENLKRVKLSNNISKISLRLFNGCLSLDSLTIPGSVTQVVQYHNSNDDGTTFQGCDNLKNLIIEYGEKILLSGKNTTFVKCGWDKWIETIENLTIDRKLYYSMTPPSLKELTLGKHTEKVQVNINKCNDLTKITCHAKTPPTGLTATNKQYMDVEVKVPKGCLEAYQNADGWKNFWNMSEMEDGESGVETMIADAPKAEIARYNLHGQMVGDDYRGMVIVKYSDGSTAKMINR